MEKGKESEKGRYYNFYDRTGKRHGYSWMTEEEARKEAELWGYTYEVRGKKKHFRKKDGEAPLSELRTCPICKGIIDPKTSSYYKTALGQRNRYYDKRCYERKISDTIVKNIHLEYKKTKSASFSDNEERIRKDSERYAKEWIEKELRMGALEEYTDGKRVDNSRKGA
jgi:hypothetical protein